MQEGRNGLSRVQSWPGVIFYELRGKETKYLGINIMIQSQNDLGRGLQDHSVPDSALAPSPNPTWPWTLPETDFIVSGYIQTVCGTCRISLSLIKSRKM